MNRQIHSGIGLVGKGQTPILTRPSVYASRRVKRADHGTNPVLLLEFAVVPGTMSELKTFKVTFWRAAVSAVLVVICLCPQVFAQYQPPNTAVTNNIIPIVISGDIAHQASIDSNSSVTVLRGHCRVVQGDATLQSQKLIIWHGQRNSISRLELYLEDAVRFETPENTLSRPTLYLSLVTRGKVQYLVRQSLQTDALFQDALYLRGERQKNATQRGTLRQTQLIMPSDDAGPVLPRVQLPAPTQDFRRIRISPRSAVPFEVLSFPSNATTPPERIAVITGGINLLIDGVKKYGTVDLTADRMVIWTEANGGDGFNPERGGTQSGDAPFQVYMEGNIVIRQGENLIHADRAFYDAREDRGLMLKAEFETFLPELNGKIRVRAQRIRQLSQQSFHAQQAYATTSRFGKPGYRLQSSDIFLTQRYTQPWLGRGSAQFDPISGAPIVEARPWIESLNNKFLIQDVPLLYTPYLSGPADPNMPLRNITMKQDRIFGSQLETVWNVFKLLGIDEPAETRWDLLADYYSERGPAVGTGGNYRGIDLFGVAGPFSGTGLSYYIHDTGNDDLGNDRRSLPTSNDNRGRVLWRHRHELPANMTIIGEVGYLSDRNFLEQYEEYEFDAGKDNETLLYLKQQYDNWAWTLFTRTQLNDFSNTTEWYPRADNFILAQPLLGGLLNYSGHSSAGYGQLRPADAPTNPADIFTPLPFVANVGGGVVVSRHELDFPLHFGAVNLVPYLFGEAGFWHQDLTRNDLQRYVGSAGVRGSIAAWRIFPFVSSRIMNLNGLAHKMVFDFDYSITDASEGLGLVPQYNEFDDNGQERFRSRLITNTFRNALPATFEPRFYAVRAGASRGVTSPYPELIDDQHALRLGWRHRLQTKVGPPEDLRIKDWMTLDLEATYFPDPNRDNFGEDIGLLGGRYNWAIGGRTSILASAYYDLFTNAQQLWNIGIISNRSTRGSAYIGVRQIRGAGVLDSQIVTASLSYTMSPKWITTMSTAFDVGEQNDLGQAWTFTRVGADFLIHFGAIVNPRQDNVGVAFTIEPRFGPRTNSRGVFGSLLTNMNQPR